MGSDGVRVTGPATQRHRLALVALLAIAGERGVGREKLVGYLWPERDGEAARLLLNQAVYQLRRAFGEDAITSVGDDLRLNATILSADVTEFEASRSRGDHAAAVSLYQGPFLDGFFLPEAAEFDFWKERERDRLSTAYGKSLEALAEAAAQEGRLDAATEWWRVRASHDPFDSRVALRYMQALEAAGIPARALQHAASHEQLLRRDVGAEPPPEVLAAVERLRKHSAGRPGSHARTPEVIQPEVTAGAHASTPPPIERGRPARRAAWIAPVAVGASVIVTVVALWSATGRDDPGPALVRAAAANPAARTRNVAAYELYLRANDQTMLRSDSTARVALDLFQQAIALDSTYAEAWAGLGRMYGRVASDMPIAQRARYQQLGLEAAMKAVALDDSLADAHATIGLRQLVVMNLKDAERHLGRALELDPSNARICEWAATTYLSLGQQERALALSQRALALEPLAASAHAEVARALLSLGRVSEAWEHLSAVRSLRPPLLRTPLLIAQYHLQQARWPEAILQLRQLADEGIPAATGLLGFAHARSGQRDVAIRLRDSLVQRGDRGDDDFEVALVSAGLGDLDSAVTRLDRALAAWTATGTPSGWPWIVVMGPLFDDLRARPGFQRLRERLGLEH